MHPPRGALYSKARLACRYSTPGSLALRYVSPMSPRPARMFDGVLFDLLTALLDSWTLWNIVAGSPENGRKWRVAYLRRTYETGAYRPYETLVAEAAAEVGLSPTLATQLAARYRELKPWPEVREVLGALRREARANSRRVYRHRFRCRRHSRARRFLQAQPTAVRDGSRRAGRSARPVPVCSRLRLRPVRHEQRRSADLLARPHWHGAASQHTRTDRAPPLALSAPRISATCRIAVYSGRRVDCQVTICHWPPLLA